MGLGRSISEPHTHHNYDDNDYDSRANNHVDVDNNFTYNNYFYNDHCFANNYNDNGCPNHHLVAVSS